MVKEFLSQKGVSYGDRDVSIDQSAARELMQRAGRMAVPVIIIDGQTIIGFDRERLEQALSRAQAASPSFGAAIADASKITGQSGQVGTPGAYVGRVRPGSVAEQVGLAAGDTIIEFNQQRVGSAGDLENSLSRLSRGSRFTIVFLRGGRPVSAEGTF